MTTDVHAQLKGRERTPSHESVVEPPWFGTSQVTTDPSPRSAAKAPSVALICFTFCSCSCTPWLSHTSQRFHHPGLEQRHVFELIELPQVAHGFCVVTTHCQLQTCFPNSPRASEGDASGRKQPTSSRLEVFSGLTSQVIQRRVGGEPQRSRCCHSIITLPACIMCGRSYRDIAKSLAASVSEAIATCLKEALLVE